MVNRSHVHGVEFIDDFTGRVCTPSGASAESASPYRVWDLRESAVDQLPLAVRKERLSEGRERRVTRSAATIGAPLPLPQLGRLLKEGGREVLRGLGAGAPAAGSGER